MYHFGMGLPIFNGATKARIKSTKIGLEITELNKSQKLEQLNTQYSKLTSTYQKQVEIFQYYKKEGIRMSDEMTRQASVRFKSGDISFAEWALLVNQALQIKISYADVVKSLQFSLAEFKYLMEKN